MKELNNYVTIEYVIVRLHLAVCSRFREPVTS